MKNRFYVVLAFILYLSCQVSAREDIALHLLRGRAALSRTSGGTWLELGPEPLNVKIGDMVRCEGDSRVEMRLSDGSVYRIKSDTVLTLVPEGILLQVGDLWINIPGRKNFQVNTPMVNCTVLGTIFDVNVDRFGYTRVRTFSGIVAVKGLDDKRKRQLVLQKGMMTFVKDKGQTDETPLRFNVNQAEAQLKSDWDKRLLPPMKLGPSRSDLPGFQKLVPDEPPVEEVPEDEISADNARSKLNFFENLRAQKLYGYKSSGNSLNAKRRGQKPHRFRALPSDHGNRLMTDEMSRQGHTLPFGHSDPHYTGAFDNNSLREEILNVQHRIDQSRERFLSTELELQALLNNIPEASLSVRAALSRDQIREKAVILQDRLNYLRENLRRLEIRLEDLRIRLR